MNSESMLRQFYNQVNTKLVSKSSVIRYMYVPDNVPDKTSKTLIVLCILGDKGIHQSIAIGILYLVSGEFVLLARQTDENIFGRDNIITHIKNVLDNQLYKAYILDNRPYEVVVELTNRKIEVAYTNTGNNETTIVLEGGEEITVLLI